MRITKSRAAAIIGGAVFAATAAAYAAGQTREDTLETVPSVNLNRYLGKWYEIARYPNRFQKKCTGDTMAEYSLVGDGKLQVVNSCRKQNGKIDIAKGKAKSVDKQSNAKLKVSFFWPFSGDYWVIGLDPEYRWAIVGEPSRKFLWILSRTPQMREADYEHALRIVRKSGYESSKLKRTPQGAGQTPELVER